MPAVVKKLAAKRESRALKSTPTPLLRAHVPNKLDATQVGKASRALLAFLSQRKPAADDLLADAKPSLDTDSNNESEVASEDIFIIITTKRIPEKKAFKPSRIPLKTPILDSESASICLFTKDPQRTYKDAVEQQGLIAVKRVIGLSKLKKKYKPYEAKRLLCNSFNLFLADERILPLLPKALGKSFFEKRKLPCPIDLSNPENLHKEIEFSLASTVFRPVVGPTNAVRIGRSDFSADMLTENVMEAMPHIVRHIPKGWSNVQSIAIKAPLSAALPIYNSI